MSRRDLRNTRSRIEVENNRPICFKCGLLIPYCNCPRRHPYKRKYNQLKEYAIEIIITAILLFVFPYILIQLFL
jgi:hypothetical protein